MSVANIRVLLRTYECWLYIRVIYIYEYYFVYTSVDLDQHQIQLRGNDLDLAISKAFATLDTLIEGGEPRLVKPTSLEP